MNINSKSLIVVAIPRPATLYKNKKAQKEQAICWSDVGLYL